MARQLIAILALAAVAAGCGQTSADQVRGFIARGDRRAAANDLVGAEIEYRNAAQAAPTSLDAHQRLLNVANSRGDSETVSREVLQLAQLVPADPGIQTTAGDLYLRLGREADAEEAFLRAVAIDPSAAAPHRGLAILYTGRHQLDDAERQWAAVASSRDGDPFALADFHAAQGHLATAERELRGLIDVIEHSDAARMRLARVLAQQGRVGEAERVIDGALRRDPRNAVAWVVRGDVRRSSHQTAAATEAYRTALDIDATSLQALAGLTAIAVDAARSGIAGPSIERATATAPDRVSLRLLAGRLYAALGEFANAERHLVTAIRLDPSSFEAFDLLGRLYIRESRLAEARQQFARVAEQQPTHLGAATMIGLLLEAEGRNAEARTQYEHVLQRWPAAGVAANNLACLYLLDGRMDEALRYGLVARAQLPHLPQALDTLGWIYLKTDRAAAALPLLSEAIERQPENPQYRFHRAVAYSATGAVAQAREDVAAALTASREFAGRDEAERLAAALERSSTLQAATRR